MDNICSSGDSGLPRNVDTVARRIRVLCIDDDPHVSEAIARTSHRFGIEVLCAYFGMQGCWLAATEKPDVIMLDLCMPKGDGLEVLAWLKNNSRTADIPVIVLTGRHDANLNRRIEHLGAMCLLHKPFSSESICERISDLFAVSN